MAASFLDRLITVLIGAGLGGLVAIAASALYLRHRTHAAPVFNSVDTNAILDFFNQRPIASTGYRVLFIGDSLTIHGQVPNLWDAYTGMAASSAENDFVHLITQRLQSQTKQRPIEILYDNGGNGRLGTMLAYYQSQPSLAPDLIILQGGENDTFDSVFREQYLQLLALSTREIVLGDWFSDEKSAFEKTAAAKRGLPFVNLRVIQRNPRNSGFDGPYHVAGVAMHPNDAGMAAIATAVIQAADPAFIQFPSQKAHPTTQR